MRILASSACILLLFIMWFSNATADNDRICRRATAIASSAISNKNRGIPKEFLTSSLPIPQNENPTGTAQSMHDILDEVYDFDTIDLTVYSTYRTEICYRRLAGKKTPQNYSLVHPKLVACSRMKELLSKITCAKMISGSHPRAGP